MTTLSLLVVLLLSQAMSTSAEPIKAQSPWDFAFKDFVIAAWNPPYTTDAEYATYREAGFNLIMHPRYDLPARALELAQKHGLKVMIDTYTPNDKPWGGTAGPYMPHPSHHPATLPELKWLHERYGKHPALAGYLLGDDYGKLPAELIETTHFLRDSAPHLIPWICQNHMNAASLAEAGNPFQDPQIYPTLYQKEWPAEAQCREFCIQLQRLRAGCREHGLTPWPMFNVCGVDSDSLIRFQVYASLAHAAQGIWYFTYFDGIQKGRGYETATEVRTHLLPGWSTAAEANRRVAAWGPELLGRTCVGLFDSTWPLPAGVRPGAGKLIEQMSSDLLVGILAKADASPLAMVVDTRTSKQRNEVPAREVEVRFAEPVTGLNVLEGGTARAINGRTLKLTLPGGGGQLVALQGDGVAARCAEIEKQAAQAAARPIGKDGLLLHLSFDEGEGAVAHDTSGSGNDVELVGVKWVPGKLGRAIRFAQPGSFGRLWDANLPAKDAMSVAAWVRPVYPTEGYGPVVYLGTGSTDRFEFGFGPDNLYPVLTDGVSHSGGQLYVAGMKQLLPEGTWGHLAVCAGPDGATTYVNGKPVRTSAYPGRFDFAARGLYLGVRLSEHYLGEMDEVQVWNRCLSEEEVAALAKLR
ncbi:MAG: hypothetical protein COZ06_26760 [Armatimonadetes bacterium CG_4_10_14_3_um_filter_66_18]|nr:LamG domain-containing protein [Armatimonadota bacterium]PIU91054.1 MAG: hypothetical protein COS65_23240 [Armatimonadetes bacterium CG06_land_8_20_14_3_00_66_21]PIX42059.1 MAG: hypothetical protein COZ57_21985 [Armatimonadetes bacterium CG_4_8_14_3_um_filter_66_20]PIY41351.1 MAG: hypothetical protein COZ06_26760 [Armatimonadetes bacterium CG_4_10_14_3_um_filter_66_18]PJB73657.1 MAG: hypothetical protein CO096_05475 [Armatimonadetes bacterium CG_4_9_14_3_um_filter_66_14]